MKEKNKNTIPAKPAEELLHESRLRQAELERQNGELRQALAALERSYNHYADFYGFLPVGCLILSREALISEINSAGATLLGEERHKLLGRHFAHFVAPEDRDHWRRYFADVLQREGKLACELGIQRTGGSRTQIQLDSLRLPWKKEMQAACIALTDITALKLSEAALHESETHLRLLEQQEIVQTSLDGFLVVNTSDARIQEANDAFCRMVGYLRHELLSMRISDLEAVKSPAEIAAHIRKVIENSHDRFETRHRHKQGRLVDLEISANYSETDGGTIFLFARDITGRKNAERQLHDLTAHLQAVREEEKNRIAREIHDELGGTLAALKIEAYRLARGLTAEQRAMPQFARIESMLSLLDEATAATRRIVADLHPTLIDDLGLLAALEWQADQFHQRTGIACRITGMLGNGNRSDKKLDKTLSINLFRIFQETLTNVARHSGASQVDAALRQEDREVMLTVNDNGCGLPHGHSPSPNSHGMRGMRERAEQLGGSIRFDTPSGGGLCVTVKLPLPLTP